MTAVAEAPQPAFANREEPGAVPQTMRAIPPHSPDLAVVETRVPDLESDRALVRVEAASINPADYHSRKDTAIMRIVGRLFSGFKKPPVYPAMGMDVAGTVVKVGADVTSLAIGDVVFGAARGSFAEYASAKFLAPKPERISFEQAAALNVAGITALQGLRDRAGLKPGDHVLINGAAGGVGTMAIQIAKALGAAEVTAVCSASKAELARSLGADGVVDYAAEDFTKTETRYEVVYDIVGNHSIGELRRITKPKGAVVLAGGGHENGYANVKMGKLLVRMLGGVMVMKLFVSQRLSTYIANTNTADLETLANMVNEGKLTPVITRSFTLDQLDQAFACLETGHATGNIGIRVGSNTGEAS